MLQLALRDLQTHLAQRNVAAPLASVALIFGIAGPFDTLGRMAPGPRLAYWTAVEGLTYAAGFLAATLAEPRLPARPIAVRLMLAALASGTGAMAALLILNAGMGQLPTDLGDPATGFGSVLLIALVIEAALAWAEPRGTHSAPAPEGGPAAATPPILTRLALDKGGALVALSVQDHYVDAVTTRGRALLLMRLGDAIRETAGVEGLQVHRSHWVALDQVAAARRTGDAAVLPLTTGGEVPVSRSRLAQVRATGLLPRGVGR